ncbi:hypothetical protein K432DRAFT_293661 [Lepidopterella palustris CBS 459.81]|uniref:Uncharacterized protein n=1 Tax=Lepidopterella palustris CBS 459.81 TaxID=1314670 RepID=A0A8E2EEE1_9PEZI|nr:hypothetical protein K432DRAFT_293661 [Lepidopterella palustris CBS 459.81]
MLSSHSASSLPNPTNSSYSDVNIPPSVRPNTSATSNASKTTLFAFAQKQPQTSLVSTPSQDESWDNFTDWEASLPPSQAKNDSPGPSLLPTVPVQNPSSDLAQVASTELPPTNVPPPGVLLSLFPPLISEAQKRLFNPIAAQTYQMKNRLLSDPAIVSFLQSYLAISTVAARIIAGRKLRWKRDMHLAQGMKVGPASSRSTSGMKLAGIDKSEAVKEDREALDVVLAWREQLGRLRSAVAVASTIKPGCLRAIPEMQEVMPVRTLKESEGGVPAPQQCALCGLKREERVNKVDIAVEDSFGEWWIEQVSMHRTCRNFWQEHKNTLKHR